MEYKKVEKLYNKFMTEVEKLYEELKNLDNYIPVPFRAFEWMLEFRLKDSELKQAIKECDEVLRNAIEDCSKHMESVYKERYNEALHLLEQLSGNAQYVEGVEFMNKLLCHGQFDSWYYSGTHGQGDSILNIIGYVEILRKPERLDQI